MSSNILERFFRERGLAPRAREPMAGCASDESLAGYAAGRLPSHERQSLERHALRCDDCHQLLRAVVDIIGAARPSLGTRLVARLSQAGLELLEGLDRLIGSPTPQPALGTLRRVGSGSDPITVQGPGLGLDELQLQALADGRASLIVRCRELPLAAEGETLSVTLLVDGSPRERRPFRGRPLSFAPLGPGLHRVSLTAHAPGRPARELASVEVELLD
jgi:hypothetical protein